MITSASSPVTRQPVLLLQAAVGFFIALKLAYFVFLPQRFGYQFGSYQLYRGDGHCGGTCR